ncbi:MAG: hypothetical protein JRF50_16090 [Deltaproteobacteria bacterium]|nr:hypothetical protein [Deltaproteobacteria bacterium]
MSGREIKIKWLEDIEAVPPFLDSSAILRDMKKSARRLTLNPDFIGKP